MSLLNPKKRNAFLWLMSYNSKMQWMANQEAVLPSLPKRKGILKTNSTDQAQHIFNQRRHCWSVFSLCSSVFFCSYRGSSCHLYLCIFIKYDEIWCLHMSDVFSVHLKLLLLSSQYFLYWPVLFHPVLAKTCATSLWNDSGYLVSWWTSCIVCCT